ncbi:MAG TPA: hypothetical protein IAC41_00020, partial [Candidatus Merdenecus merdavium]|nr:hypothetical protein [Candidatus Merdenecus merdavium]
MAKDFFEDMGKVFTETVEDISRKTGEAVEIQKLKRKRSTLKREVNDRYRELGEKVYAKYKVGELLDPDFGDY